MADLYIDEGVAVATVALLRAHGHRVVHAVHVRPRAKDDVQLLTAAQSGQILVTNNGDDFRLLNEAWHHWPAPWGTPRPPQHAGILIVGNKWLAHEIADRVDDFCRGHHYYQGTATNRLYVWVDGSGWEDRPPRPI